MGWLKASCGSDVCTTCKERVLPTVGLPRVMAFPWRAAGGGLFLGDTPSVGVTKDEQMHLVVFALVDIFNNYIHLALKLGKKKSF